MQCISKTTRTMHFVVSSSVFMEMVAQRLDIPSGRKLNQHLGKCLQVAGHFMHELKRQIKIHKLYVVMIILKLEWPLMILYNWKNLYKVIIENQEIRKACLSETHALGNREASTHNGWWNAKLMEQVPARKIKTYMERWSLRIFDGVLNINSPNSDDEFIIFCQGVHGVVNVDFFSTVFSTIF